MKLLALHLTNVRKFTGKRASITGIGDGITVVSEANEFGKSTFFDAIHALFFEKYGSSAKPVKSLQPYAGGAVEVAADIETDQGAFRVEKRFLSRKGAKIIRLSDHATVAQDDEAERWITELLGAAGDGPAGLLWVRQGLVGLEPDSSKEKAQLMETRRDLLSSVAGEIDAMTGGRRMDRVMRQVAENFAQIATKTGRKTGVWKAASDDVESLEAELVTLSAQVDKLDAALSGRIQSEASLARFDDADAKARRDHALRVAATAMEEARAHAGLVTTARQERDLAALHAKNAKSVLDAFLAAIDTLQTAQTAAAKGTAQARAAQGEVSRLKSALEFALTSHKATTDAVTEARKLLDAARRQTNARKAKADASRLKGQITKAAKAVSDRDASRARVKASNATPDRLSRAEAAESEVVKLEAALQAQATTLNITYSGGTRVTMNGTPVPDDQPVMLDGQTQLDLPGIGQMVIRTQSNGDAGKDQLARAKALRDDLLADVGADTIQAARILVAECAEADTAADLAQAVLDTLAPDGIEALRAAMAEADLAAASAHDEPLPEIGDLENTLAEAVTTEDQARQALSRAEVDHSTAREDTVKTHAAAETAQLALDRAKADAGPEENREKHRADLLRSEAQTSLALTEAEAALTALTLAAPDLETARAEVKRAEDAVTTAFTQRAQVAERLAGLSSEIRTLAGNGIEERRDDLKGQLETARTTEARFAKKAAALTRLQNALEAERNAARETYFGPVQEELKPLLSMLHRDAALSFDSESLLPSGLTRENTEEMLDDLSSGTKEQIAILTRLAFARLFARQGRHMPIVLDDALVYSDDDRIIKMFTALTRVAKDQQILVFSCRQLAFQDLGGNRPRVEITDV